MKKELSILIASCDKYSDLWTPCITLIRRSWPECPDIYVMSNEKPCELENVKPLVVGQLESWSTELKTALERVESKYVLLLLDDFFFRKKINTCQFDDCFKFLVKNDGAMIRLVVRPGPDVKIPGNRLIGGLAMGAAYRASTQGTIWRVDVLRGLLQEGESIWEFEDKGTQRAAALDGFYGVWHDVLPYGHHVVQRGKWFRGEFNRFSAMNIGCESGARPVMGRKEMFEWWIQKIKGELSFRIRKQLGLL